MSFTSDRLNDSADFPTQDGRSIAIETPLGKDAVVLIALDGVDQVSRGFVYTVEFMTRAVDQQIRTLLGKPVTLWLHNNSETARRPLHGHVRHLTRLNQDGRLYRRWRAEIVPQMWFLTCNVDCRIYQNLSPIDIISSILDDYGLSHYQFRLLDTYQKFNYCVQYRESAFDFVSRLMEHAGISYWFEHAEDRHMLIMSDSNRLAPFCQPRKVTISERSDLGEIQEVTQDFGVHTGHWALNDFDFEVPTKNLRTRQSTVFASMMAGGLEKFDYPGHYTSPDQGKWLTRLRIEEEEVRHSQMSGLGSCVGFDPGRRFEFEQHDATGAAQVAEYFLTEVRHAANQPINYNNTDQPAVYSNQFVCIPADVPFRPERSTPMPIISGLQTATVVGPSGESIHVDNYGRIRVLFHWDRRGKRDEHASCWIRVSQQSAGSYWGGVTIPHVGQEVIVAFLEGNPDRPMVMGQVHNGTNMPPLTLPADKDKSITRDHGDNKIVMQGKAGKQHLSIVSPGAVNMYAVKSVGKALSADITFFDRNGTFHDPIDGFEDYNSLSELFTLFKAMDDPSNPVFQDTNSPGKTLTSVSADPTGGPVDVSNTALADTAATCDINSMSEGNINGLSLGNTNAWVYKDSNQWVNGDVNVLVNGNSDTNINQSASVTVQGSNSTIANVSNTTTTPSNYTFASSNVTLTDTNLTDAYDNWTLYGGINATLGIGLNLTVNSLLNIQQAGLNIQECQLALTANLVDIGTYDTVKYAASGLNIGSAILTMIL